MDASGVSTVEGLKAGGLAAALASQRQAASAAFAAKKAEVAAESDRILGRVGAFAAQAVPAVSSYDAEFKAKTTGLVTVDEFRRAREEIAAKEALASMKGSSAASNTGHAGVAAAAAAAAAARAGGSGGNGAATTGAMKAADALKRGRAAMLSFGDDDEEERSSITVAVRGRSSLDTSRAVRATPASASAGAQGGTGAGTGADVPQGTGDAATAGTGARAGAGTGVGEEAAAPTEAVMEVVPAKRARMCKDPSVETSFLPDAERERREEELREQLRREWVLEQERIKKEKIEVVYSWWDGTGHRRSSVVPKGLTIGKFMEVVRQELMTAFPTLRSITSDNLLYVKEDCIIPHNLSFYDLIVNNARGLTGPMVSFGVHDDVRLTNDSRVEKDESHPGKIVERRWYEKNKHLYPASRWILFDLTNQPKTTFSVPGQGALAK